MLQLGILILTLSMVVIMYNLRNQTTHTRTRTRTRQPNETTRHLAQSSRHLARATRSTSQHARAALFEADTALSISPREPSAHIHRARALHLLGHPAAALRSLDSALSSPAARSLSAAERAEALVERAELKVEMNRRRRVESAVKDLVEAVGLMSGGEEVESEALCLLGQCYEWKGMKEEAKEAFLKVLDVEPDSLEARNGLDRLGP